MKEIAMGFDTLKELTTTRIKELTKQVKKLEKENQVLRIKYPNKKSKKDKYGTQSAEDIIKDLPQ